MNADALLDPSTAHVELAARDGDGIFVQLLWDRSTNRVTVRVHDERSGDRFELPVSGDDALDVYRHPYVYAASRGAPGRRWCS